MTKKAFIALAAIGMLFFLQHPAFAQPSDGFQGIYRFDTTGLALLTDSNCNVSGIVPAALVSGSSNLNGHGQIEGSGSNVGINIGPSSCTSDNYFISGTYTGVKNPNGTIQISGMLTTNFQGRGFGCAGTRLADLPFSMLLTPGIFETALKIVTYGAGDGSSYAQGGAFSICSATVDYFVTSGVGRKHLPAPTRTLQN